MTDSKSRIRDLRLGDRQLSVSASNLESRFRDFESFVDAMEVLR